MEQLANSLLEDIEYMSYDNYDEFDKYEYYCSVIKDKIQKLCYMILREEEN